MSDTKITGKNAQAQALTPQQQQDATKLRGDLDTLNAATGIKDILHAKKDVNADLKQMSASKDHMEVGQVRSIISDSAIQTHSHLLAQYLQGDDKHKITDSEARGHLNNAYCVWARNNGRHEGKLASKQEFAKLIAPTLQQEGVGPQQIEDVMKQAQLPWKPPTSNRV